MNLNKPLIDGFANFLFGENIWGKLQSVVRIVEDPSSTGEQKRQAAISKAEEIGIDLAGFMLNLGIELAVAYIRSQVDKNA